MPSPIAFKRYKDIMRIATGAKTTRVAVDASKNLFIKTCDQSGGFLLGKAMARDCAEYIRKTLIEQKFLRKAPGPSPYWIEKQRELGVDEDDIFDIGFAKTHTLVDAIDHIRTSDGGFRVGIRQKGPGSKMPTTVTNAEGKKVRYGKYTKTLEVAEALEFGVEASNQPERPWFMPGFYSWFDNNMPKVVSKEFLVKYNSVLSKYPSFIPVDNLRNRTAQEMVSESAARAAMGGARAVSTDKEFRAVEETDFGPREKDPFKRDWEAADQAGIVKGTGKAKSREKKIGDQWVRVVGSKKKGTEAVVAYWDSASNYWVEL